MDNLNKYVGPKQQTVVRLHRNVDSSNGRYLVFSNEDERDRYFNERTVWTRNDFSLVEPKSGEVRVGANIGTVNECNYISWKNVNFGDKWFFGPIHSVEYRANGTTAIQFSVDWFVTDMFVAQYNSTIIERQHLSEGDYQKIKANPYDRTVYEMEGHENVTIPEHQMTMRGITAFQIPEVGSEFMLTVGVSPFRDAQAEQTAGITDEEFKKKRDEILKKYNVDDWAEPLNDKSTLKEVAKRQKDNQDKLREMRKNGTLTNGDDIWGALNYSADYAVESIGRFVNMSHNLIEKGINTWNGNDAKARTEIEQLEARYWAAKSARKAKNSWNDLIAKFPEFIPPGARDGLMMGVYVLAVPNNANGVQRVAELMNWLSKRGMTHSIVFFYSLPAVMFTGDPDTYEVNLPQAVIDSDPKLARAPFSYISAEAPDGAEREYSFENFSNGAKFITAVSMTGQPIISVLPVGYLSLPGVYNMSDRIEFTGFPQLPYATDAFVNYQAQQAAAALTQSSGPSQYQYHASQSLGGIDVLSNTIQGLAGSAMMAPSNPYQAGLSAGQGLINAPRSLADLEIARHARQRTISESRAVLDGDRMSDMWATAAPAHRVHDYKPGSTGGQLPYLINGCSFRFDVRTVATEYRPRYVALFQRYGYASGRLGVPWVVYYMQGGDALTHPHWAQLDNVSPKTTYVKTDGLSVISSNKESQKFIEDVFNNGATFVKGV